MQNLFFRFSLDTDLKQIQHKEHNHRHVFLGDLSIDQLTAGIQKPKIFQKKFTYNKSLKTTTHIKTFIYHLQTNTLDKVTSGVIKTHYSDLDEIFIM